MDYIEKYTQKTQERKEFDHQMIIKLSNEIEDLKQKIPESEDSISFDMPDEQKTKFEQLITELKASVHYLY